MATLAQWLVALSQGIAFFHAGDELLRSKSLDRDSYDSGEFLDYSVHHHCKRHATQNAAEMGRLHEVHSLIDGRAPSQIPGSMPYQAQTADQCTRRSK